MDLTGLVLEASMWFSVKLKTAIDAQISYFALADNFGYNQIKVGDVIQVNHTRMPEKMLVVGFDESNHLVWVERGYENTQTSAWKKGQKLRIFRFRNVPARTQMSFEDVAQIDGTVRNDQLMDSVLEYDWRPEDTCMPGCYYMEFVLRKLRDPAVFIPNGTWYGQTHQDPSTYVYYTGSTHSNSSVALSLDAFGVFHLPAQQEWVGPTHIYNVVVPPPPPMPPPPVGPSPIPQVPVPPPVPDINWVPPPNSWEPPYNWGPPYYWFPPPDAGYSAIDNIGFYWSSAEPLGAGQPVPDPPDYLFEPMAPPPSGLWGASAVPYYTGTAHDDGSVPINTTAVPIEPEQSYSAGVTGTLYADENHVSDSPNVGGGSTWVVSSGPTLPSSPPITLSEGIGCCVGAGVEWERRFPTCGEGFLVLVNDSPTTTC